MITGRELQSRLMGHDIYRATNFEILPLNPNVSIENPPHVVESNFLALVRSHFQHGNFLFSYTWDLTTRLQAQAQRPSGAEKPALWQLVSPLSLICISSAQTVRIGGRPLLLEQVPPNPTHRVCYLVQRNHFSEYSGLLHGAQPYPKLSGHPTSFQFCMGPLTSGLSSSMAAKCNSASSAGVLDTELVHVTSAVASIMRATLPTSTRRNKSSSLKALQD